MSAREIIYDALVDDPSFVAMVPLERILGASRINENPDKPFVSIQMAPVIPGPFKPIAYHDGMIWAHDVPGSYTRIDDILARTHEVLFAVPSDDEKRFIIAVWQGDGQDAVDDGYNTIVRTGSFRLIMTDGGMS